MRERLRPIVTMQAENVAVSNAYEGEYVCSAGTSTPPEEDPTMRVTTGRSQTVVIDLSECCWRVILLDLGKLLQLTLVVYEPSTHITCIMPKQHAIEIATLIHQHAHTV
jgi:hypothetical protein